MDKHDVIFELKRKAAISLYPDFDGTESDYQPIVDLFGDVVLQVQDEDYQGDTWVLYKRGETRYGRLEFGWGSCSGCDALQACGSLGEIDQLINELYNSIEWFDDASVALKYFKEHNADEDIGGNDKAFTEKAIELLEAVVGKKA
jgi:hypothetical protein